MKKMMFLSIIGVLLLTGCGKSSNKNQVVCTGTQEEGGYKASLKVAANLKDDKITSASVEMTFDSEETASQMCSMYALMNSMAESEDEKIPYECKGKTLKITDLSKFDSEDDEESVIGMSKADFIEGMEKESLSCK